MVLVCEDVLSMCWWRECDRGGDGYLASIHFGGRGGYESREEGGDDDCGAHFGGFGVGWLVGSEVLWKES